MRKITPSPLAPADALATISPEILQLDGSGGSVAFEAASDGWVICWGLKFQGDYQRTYGCMKLCSLLRTAVVEPRVA